MKHKRAVLFITLGILCILSALSLAVYNIIDENNAQKSVTQTIQELDTQIPEKTEAQQLTVPLEQPVVPALFVDGYNYIGVLNIPALGLTLPVQDTWSDKQLKVSPCLYKGNLFDGMIIAGHSYKAHFKYLSSLNIGDTITFTDIDGNVWNYTVCATEIINGYDVEQMEKGDFDLTLFTCTYTSKDRFTVRCKLML